MGPENRTSNPCPALYELRERLTAHGVNADPLRVASAILDIINSRQEHTHPVVEWIEQLAIDVTKVKHLRESLGQQSR